MSTDYYIRLEQGRNEKVSGSTLDAVARALRLTEVERVHLHNLARPPRKPYLPAEPEQVMPGLRQLLDTMVDVPAYVIGRRTDVLAWNTPACLIFADFDMLPAQWCNMARLVFFDPAARQVYRDWEAKARDVVAYLRLNSARRPGDGATSALLAELSRQSAEFRRLWDLQQVHEKTTGYYRLHHPEIGPFRLRYRALRLPEEPGQSLITYIVDPDTPVAARLRRLAVPIPAGTVRHDGG